MRKFDCQVKIKKNMHSIWTKNLIISNEWLSTRVVNLQQKKIFYLIFVTIKFDYKDENDERTFLSVSMTSLNFIYPNYFKNEIKI